MFNDAQKQRFINIDDSIVKSTLIGLFGKAEMLETMYDKDLYNFTEEQGIEFLKCLRSTSIESLGVQMSMIIRYVDWALSENLVIDGVNHFREITKEQRDSCISAKASNKYYTFAEIKEICDKLADNPVNQYVVLSPWYAIGAKKREEMEQIGVDNLQGDIITIEDREIHVDKYFIDIFKKSCNTYVYYSNSLTRDMIGVGAWKQCTNTRGGNFKTKINSKYLRISKLVGKELNYNVIKFSAMMHHVKRRSEMLGIDNREFVFSNDMIEILNMYEFRTSLSDAQRKSTFWYKFGIYLE